MPRNTLVGALKLHPTTATTCRAHRGSRFYAQQDCFVTLVEEGGIWIMLVTTKDGRNYNKMRNKQASVCKINKRKLERKPETQRRCDLAPPALQKATVRAPSAP